MSKQDGIARVRAELQAKLAKLDGADKRRAEIRDRIQAVRAKYAAKKKANEKIP